MRWNAVDIIQRGQQDERMFRKWDKNDFIEYVHTTRDGVFDVYSHTKTKEDTIYNPREFSYDSPHRFTLVVSDGNYWVLDPLRWKKSSTAQPFDTYLATISSSHYLLISKSFIPLSTTTYIDKEPPVIYDTSLLSSLIIHYSKWNIQLLYWLEKKDVQWILFTHAFQYVHPTWDMTTIHKNTIVRFSTNSMLQNPRSFSRNWKSSSLFWKHDRFSQEVHTTYYTDRS